LLQPPVPPLEDADFRQLQPVLERLRATLAVVLPPQRVLILLADALHHQLAHLVFDRLQPPLDRLQPQKDLL